MADTILTPIEISTPGVQLCAIGFAKLLENGETLHEGGVDDAQDEAIPVGGVSATTSNGSLTTADVRPNPDAIILGGISFAAYQSALCTLLCASGMTPSDDHYIRFRYWGSAGTKLTHDKAVTVATALPSR